jgi:hypothetical protein
MHETETSTAAPAAESRRGPRMALAALVLAGALGIVGVGSVFAADESTGASSSPAASASADTGADSGTDSQGSSQNCPERANPSAEESSS